MRARRDGLAALLTLALAAAASAEPEANGGGDVLLGAEPTGVDASEWEVLMRGSETGTLDAGGLQALLQSPNVALVAFYKNLNRSLAADEDDAYHVYSRRCSTAATLLEDCAAAAVVFDHLIFTRSATPDGAFAYEVVGLDVESPVGTSLAIAPVNPFGLPLAPGPVSTDDRDDPRRDPRALSLLVDEVAAATRSLTETEPATENGLVRDFIPHENTTYPYPYERISVVFDDSDAPDLLFVGTPSGDLANSPPRGGHGSLDVTQSRATLLVSGRGARRTPLDPADEAELEIKHVDLAPTVARVLGVPVHEAAKHLNAGDAASNPDAEDDLLLLRQDGKPLDTLLEPRLNVFVVVIDGMVPENITATETPNLCNLIACPGAAAPDASARSTVYEQARSVMVSETNANHTAMMTGAYGETSGIVANGAIDRSTQSEIDLDEPDLIRVDTLFDVLRRDLPHLSTAAVLGKSKLRQLFDCTDAGGTCGGPESGNPEAVSVSHVRPDYLRGALDAPAPPGPGDCPAEPASGSGVALDDCVMDHVIELSATEDPDFTFVNLANVDGLQHVDGPNSPAGDAAVSAADVEIGRLVQYLKESGKWEHSVLLISADHSFSWQSPPPANRIDLESLFDPCDDAGETFQVSGGGTAFVYLDSIGVATGPPLTLAQEQALSCMRTLALAETGVSEAWYRFENSLDPGNSVAANRPDWHLADQRAGDLVVTALASGPTAGPTAPTAPGGNAFEVASGAGYTLNSAASASGALIGNHGHPGARHVPFIVVGGGDFIVDQSVAPTGAVNEGDDTAANPGQSEAVDIAPTVAWMFGLDPATALPDAEGRVLGEAFTMRPIDAVEPHANRAVIVIFDGNNSVRIHDLMATCDENDCSVTENEPVAAVRSLVLRDTDGRDDVPVGTLTSYGSMAGHPTVTFPNHNVVGSGVYAGHHGIINNRYYERDIETERDPIDSQDPRNPVFFFSSALMRDDFETLHEAVHRAFGNWQPTPADPLCDPQTEVCDGPSGAYTASVNEPSARGADFASLETVSSENFPALFAFLTANSTEFAADTDMECAEESPGGYGQESVLDHLGQAQARALYADPSTSSLTRPSGVDPLLIDDSAGAAHPDPKYLIANNTLTDGAGHEYGPHGRCTARAYRDTSLRLGRILGELRNHGRFDTEGEPARLGETFLLLTGDHGMENQDTQPGGAGGFDVELSDADVEYVRQGPLVYLLTLDVEIEGMPPGGPVAGEPLTLSLVVTDADLRADGSATPIRGALVSVESASGQRKALTDINGRAIVSTVPAGDTLRIVVDRDGDPASGGRTTGSTSPDPSSHGIVSKQDFNDRVIEFPIAAP